MSLIAAEDNSGYFVFAFFAIFIGVFIFVGWLQNTRAKKNLLELAGRLGIFPNPDLRIPVLNRSQTRAAFGLKIGGPNSELGIMGSVRGRTVRISKYTMGSGKSQQIWAELAVSTHANGFSFTLRPNNFAWKFVEVFGFDDVKVGDEAFDQRWRIKTPNAATLQALLLPELRAKINNTAARNGDFTLEDDWIRYREQGRFSNPKLVARYEGMVGMMGDLAEAIEVAAEKYSPPLSN